MPAGPLKRTPLYELHRELGARMVEFGGWEMPVQYSGIIEEHLAVRRAVGLFDVSHMGEIEIRGPEALALVEYVTTNQASRLNAGQAQYSAMLYEHGGFVDDLLVHKVADDHYFLCVNASNQEKDYRHILRYNRFRAEVEFTSDRYVQLALQGPSAEQTLRRLTRDGSDRDPLLPLHGRRSLRRAGPHRAHRLYRRGRLRAVPGARARRARLP
jgi:aminomethyltransferase